MTETAAQPESAAQAVGRRVRRWRGTVLAVLALGLVAVLLAAVRPEESSGRLDPESAAGNGSRALAEIVRRNGVPVERATTVREARALGEQGAGGALLVVVRSERLTERRLSTLSRTSMDLLLVEPTDTALDRLAPHVARATSTAKDSADPDCPLPAAQTAGRASFGDSQVFTAPGWALSCYPADDDGLPRLVRVTEGRTVTVLGSGRPLVNDGLLEEGNAALGMNLLDGYARIVWLVPDLPEEEAGDTSLTELIPPGVTLFLWQAVIAVVLLALWRARRLGPVVVERLPVAVRSAETVEGRSRLYRAAQARDRAALALRESARERLVPLLGLPRSAAADPEKAQQVTSLVASRTGWDQQRAFWTLYGPDPADDAELVRLTDLLDDLEKRLR